MQYMTSWWYNNQWGGRCRDGVDSPFDRAAKRLNHSRVVEAIHRCAEVPLRVINGLAFPRHCVFVMQITRAVGTRKIEWEDRVPPQFQLLRR